MNLRPSLSTARGAALACMLLAGFVALRWLLRFEWEAGVPGLSKTSFTAAMLLLIGSITVWVMAGWPAARAPGPRAARVLRGLALALSIMPALMLAETVLGVSLGVDIAHRDALPTPQIPHPGRTSPNACVAFLLLFAALGLLAGAPGRSAQRLSAFAIGAALLIACMGVLGYLLRLEQLYHWGNLNRMTLATALGQTLLAIALWDQRLRWSGLAARMDLHERRITWRSMAVLSVVAVAAGAGGFAALEVEFERARQDDIRSTAFITGEALTHTLDGGIWLSTTIATRPIVIEQLTRLAANAGDTEARDRLRAITRSVLTGGITAARFLDPANRLLTEAGRRAVTPAMPALSLAQQHAPNARIVWAGGYVLLTDLPVMDRGQLVGIFQAEHRLSLMDRLVARVRDTDASADVLICNRVADRVNCLPSKLHPEPANVPMFDDNGQPYLPISRALMGR